MPLSKVELINMRAKLMKAKSLISNVRDVYLAIGGHLENARVLNEVALLIDDEVAAIGKMIA